MYKKNIYIYIYINVYIYIYIQYTCKLKPEMAYLCEATPLVYRNYMGKYWNYKQICWNYKEELLEI